MTTVAIDEITRYMLGEISTGNETLGETVKRLVIEEFRRLGISVPQKVPAK